MQKQTQERQHALIDGFQKYSENLAMMYCDAFTSTPAAVAVPGGKCEQERSE